MDSIDDVNKLDDTDDINSEILSTLVFVLLPPFLWSTVIDIRNRDPSNVLLTVLSRIKGYHAEIENDVEFTLKITKWRKFVLFHCKFLVRNSRLNPQFLRSQ